MVGRSWLEVLVSARKAAGLSRRELSLRMGMSPGYVSACERRDQLPSVEVAEKWLDGCGLQLEIKPAG